MTRLKQLREERGWNMKEAAKELHLPYTTYIGYEKGDRTPNFDSICDMAEFFNVSPTYLMGTSDVRGRFPKEESDYMPDGLAVMPLTLRVPRLGMIACGEPILAEQNIEGYDEVPHWIRCDYTLECRGESMIEARICDGDIVCIRKQETVDHNQIAAVLIDGDDEPRATLKRVRYIQGGVMLYPENKRMEPRVYMGEEANRVHVIGVATHFISRVR